VALKQIRSTTRQAPQDAPPTEVSRRVVLIVDDDAGLLRLLTLILRSADYDVATALNGVDALDVAERQHVDVIVLDLRMPVLDGPGFFRELRARGDKTPVLVASSVGARDAQRELGAEGAIEKPFEPEDLLAAVGSLIH
jgi:two-component system response regulator AtoC